MHVYVPVPLSLQQALGAIELVRRVNSRLQSSATASTSSASPATPVLNLDRRLEAFSSSPSSSSTTLLHLSLSRCAPLTRPQWHSFLESLRTCLTAEEADFFCSSSSGGASTSISLRGLAALANVQRATTFLALGNERACSSSSSSPSSSSGTAVAALVRAVDAAAALCGIPPLREDRDDFVPHVSLGWVSGDEGARVARAAAATEEEEEERGHKEEVLLSLSVPIASVVCRVGKREHVVWHAAAAAAASR